MESIILAFVVCASNAFCFVLGARYGHPPEKKEKTNISLIPKAVKKKRDEEKEWERVSVILRNVENYDGTAMGQVAVPGGG